jgi:hypothetical protein
VSKYWLWLSEDGAYALCETAQPHMRLVWYEHVPTADQACRLMRGVLTALRGP